MAAMADVAICGFHAHDVLISKLVSAAYGRMGATMVQRYRRAL